MKALEMGGLWPRVGGFELTGCDLIFIPSLDSQASTSLSMTSINSSIFQCSSVSSRAAQSLRSLGSLDIIMGIKRLPYCSKVTSKAARPLMCTIIWSYTDRSDWGWHKQTVHHMSCHNLFRPFEPNLQQIYRIVIIFSSQCQSLDWTNRSSI